MSNSIKLDPKYGVNPSIDICFWCGKDSGNISLLGHIKGGKEAPRYSINTYEPCDSCKKLGEGKIMLLHVVNEQKGNEPSIIEGAYPTGVHWYLPPKQKTGYSKIQLITKEVADQLGLRFPND